MSNFFTSVVKKIPFVVSAGVCGQVGYVVFRQAFNVENESIKRSFYGNLTTPLDPHTQKAVDAVYDKIIFVASAKQCALTNFYWSNKPTIQCMGSTLSRFGTYVGIPIHFRYQSVSEVDLSDLESRLEPTIENRERLQRLRELLVLSENAKKFALASEFLTANSFRLPVQCSAALTYFFGYLILRFIFAPAIESGSPLQSFKILVSVIAFLIVIHYQISKIYYRTLRTSSDRQAAKFGEDFLDGGIEYLQNLIEKNKILRELDPSVAGHLFKPNGDEIQGFFNISRMTLNERLAHLKNIKEKQQEAAKLKSEISEE